MYAIRSYYVFLRAYSVDCDYLNAVCNLSEFYKQGRNHKRELFFRQEALKVESHNPEHWNALALCWLELANLAEVKKAFEHSLALDDSQASVRAYLAELGSLSC